MQALWGLGSVVKGVRAGRQDQMEAASSHFPQRSPLQTLSSINYRLVPSALHSRGGRQTMAAWHVGSEVRQNGGEHSSASSSHRRGGVPPALPGLALALSSPFLAGAGRALLLLESILTTGDCSGGRQQQQPRDMRPPWMFQEPLVQGENPPPILQGNLSH